MSVLRLNQKTMKPKRHSDANPTHMDNNVIKKIEAKVRREAFQKKRKDLHCITRKMTQTKLLLEFVLKFTEWILACCTQSQTQKSCYNKNLI